MIGDAYRAAIRASQLSIASNIVFAAIKIVAGVLGKSYALVADGIESMADVVSSAIVWGGLSLAGKPPDSMHPYGHGKAETLASVAVAFSLLAAAVLIAVQSIREIRVPHHAPHPLTLPVLVLVVVGKESLSRLLLRRGVATGSSALQGDAWHHRSDALTSGAAFVGIAVALIGGKGFESADDWAALAACGVILYNGVRLLQPALHEAMDAAAPPETESEVRRLAAGVAGVVDVEKCRIRKSGLHLLMDIHITVAARLSVREGHAIAHEVKDRLTGSHLRIADVTVHVEPDDLAMAKNKSL